MDKLALYTEGRGKITVADASAVVVATAEASPWAITDAITAGDARAALNALEGQLTQSGQEYRLLGLLGWHLRRALKAKHMQQAGLGEAEIFRTLKIFGQGQSALRRLLSRRGLEQMCGDFRRLIQADLAMKTGTDTKAALQSLIVSLC
jgi:DNA polymerase III subunit delta